VGGAHVAFGGWSVGDQDGLVIVPRERTDEILGEAGGKVATESEIRESARRGTLPLEAYERLGTF
jgi:4-hydroxy-4-methyl-2-oxoglutarate aldolase